MPRIKPRPDGPFWPVNEPPHRARVVEALLADPRVSLDRRAAEALVSQVTTRASDLLMRTGALRDPLFRKYTLADGEWVQTLRVRTTLDIPWWHNTRVEPHWSDPKAPLRPWPTTDTAEAPVARLHTACADYGAAVTLVDKAGIFLNDEISDLKRRYSLRDDMARNGQEHPGISVLHELSWPDPASGGRLARTVLARVLGNSRAAVRLDLLGLTPVEAAFGIPLRALRGAPQGTARANELIGSAPAVIEDPAAGWNQLMAAYELASDAAAGEVELPDGYERLGEFDLEAVARMAAVETDVVVGVSDPDRLLELVQKLNVRDHLRGNQDLEEEARLLALGGEILDTHRRDGRITATATVELYGAAPPDAIAPDATPVVAEAVRRARLLELIFPVDQTATRAVGAVMGEPANRSQVSGPQIRQRARVFTALATRGRHNPRAGEDVLTHPQGKRGVRLPDGSVVDWLEAAVADPDGNAADALLGPLGVIWLIENGLFGAPRGSDPQGRRTAQNVINALRADRVRAIGLMLELYSAAASGGIASEVDEGGQSLPGTQVSRGWFDKTFPPTRRARSKGSKPAAGPVTPAAELATAKIDLLTNIRDAGEYDTVLTEAIDRIVALCEENDLTIDDAWYRSVRDAVDDMVRRLERRPDYTRLRTLTGE